MENKPGSTGYAAVTFIAGALLIFIASNLVSYFGQCQYDDLPNIWSCAEPSATSVMGYFDVAIFLLAYPALGIGIILALVRMIQRK